MLLIDIVYYGKEPAIIIAILALVMSIISLVATIIHNFRTVAPLLTDLYHYNDTCSSNDHNFVYELKNCGLGPAIISSIKYKHNSNVFENSIDLLNNFNSLWSLQGSLTTTFILVDKHILASNEKMGLFTLDIQDKRLKDLFFEYFDKVEIEVKYKSIYKKERTFIRKPREN